MDESSDDEEEQPATSPPVDDSWFGGGGALGGDGLDTTADFFGAGDGSGGADGDGSGGDDERSANAAQPQWFGDDEGEDGVEDDTATDADDT